MSHESALEVYDLADVAPSEVHLTLPRSQRWRRATEGTRLHHPRRHRAAAKGCSGTTLRALEAIIEAA